MSEHSEYDYSLNAERQREARRRVHLANLERIENTTNQFLEGYEEKLEDLISQGLHEFLPEEFEKVSSMIQRTRSLINENDPISAREESRAIGEILHSLPQRSRIARRENAEREREAHDEKIKALNAFMEGHLSHVTDPVEKEFAWELFKDAIGTEFSGEMDARRLEAVDDRIREAAPLMLAEANQKAESWKIEQVRKRSLEEFRKEATIALDQLKEAKGKGLDLEEEIRVLNSLMDASAQQRETDMELLNGQLEKIRDRVRQKEESESNRRELTRQLLESLRKEGWTVGGPRLVDGSVVLHAQKPNRETAELKVSDGGTLLSKFEGFEGQKCLESIDAVVKHLNEAYGTGL